MKQTTSNNRRPFKIAPATIRDTVSQQQYQEMIALAEDSSKHLLDIIKKYIGKKRDLSVSS
jgi:hypothetical protein